jgi:ABC-type branched-subunit amino acid transport system ATPase component
MRNDGKRLDGQNADIGGRDGVLLEALNVTVRYGGLTALSNVTVAVPERSIVGLIGPNGAGKTTLFGVLSGLVNCSEGHVYIGSKDVTKASPRARARMGLARTFKQLELFAGLTVREHLILAYRLRNSRRRLWRDLVDVRSLLRPDALEVERVQSLLEMLSIEEFSEQLATALPLGVARLVEVGRALATSPRIVLLDEPCSGLDPRDSEMLAATLTRIVEEQNLSLFE